MIKRIGIITDRPQNIFHHHIITGVQGFFQSHDDSINVFAIGETDDIRNLVDKFDGLIVIANALSEDDLQILHQMGKPLTLVSHYVDAIPAVGQNNVDGMYQLIYYLVDRCKRRNLVFICGDMKQHDAVERERVFQQHMLLYDLIVPESHILQGEFLPEVAAQSMREFIQAGYTFDAVLASDYVMGVAILEVLQESGFNVPEDVCVVGFGDGEEAIAVGLSTIGVDVVEMGRRAARQLLAQMNGQRLNGVTWLSVEMMPRETCLPVDAPE